MTLLLIVKLAAVAVLVNSFEYLSKRNLLSDSGLMAWSVARLRSVWLAGGVRGTTLNALLQYPRVIWLLYLQIVLAVIILISPRSIALHPAAVGLVALTLLLFIIRSRFGHDGADQMSLITFVGLSISLLVGSPIAKQSFLLFLSVQATLAYLVAGIAKLSASGWRDGTFLVSICSTRMYGDAGVALYLEKHSHFAAILAWVIISWECLFPLVALSAPVSLTLPILVTGVLFHISNGWIMGLNSFIWSFVATYPALLYTSALLHQ